MVKGHFRKRLDDSSFWLLRVVGSDQGVRIYAAVVITCVLYGDLLRL
jgi:hypothetical protein